jgi:hypothetical protein
MGSMRRPDVFRLLNWDEMFLLQQVFGLMVLPPREQIAVSNGLGLGGAPYTTTGPFGGELTPDARYAIHLGDVVSRNLTSDASTTPILGDDYSNISELFIHVMTHVWQLFNGWSSGDLIVGTINAHTIGSYEVKAGDPWDDYNTEQQATIVEKWHRGGRRTASELFPYIQLIVRLGGKNEKYRAMGLWQLKLIVEGHSAVEVPDTGHLDIHTTEPMTGPRLEEELITILKESYKKPMSQDMAGGRADWNKCSARCPTSMPNACCCDSRHAAKQTHLRRCFTASCPRHSSRSCWAYWQSGLRRPEGMTAPATIAAAVVELENLRRAMVSICLAVRHCNGSSSAPENKRGAVFCRRGRHRSQAPGCKQSAAGTNRLAICSTDMASASWKRLSSRPAASFAAIRALEILASCSARNSRSQALNLHSGTSHFHS